MKTSGFSIVASFAGCSSRSHEEYEDHDDFLYKQPSWSSCSWCLRDLQALAFDRVRNVIACLARSQCAANFGRAVAGHDRLLQDPKSTRLNSSHVSISYAVFCLKKKNT